MTGLRRFSPLVTSVLLCTMSACDGCPPSAGGGAGAPQAVAIFQGYEFDTYPTPSSHHTAKVCDVIAVRVDYKPPLPPGTAARIRLETFGGATAELGQAVPPLQEISQNAIADGSLGFGFHFISGRPPGSADIVIEVAGRPAQRITVRIIP